MKWTSEQNDAINRSGSNIIVSAGAGSGKTAVLSERVLKKVSDGIDIRSILILTFTNEAAGEMKNRIRKKLEKAGFLEQLEYIDSAYITTFDAYALAIVRKYHYLLNISKNISIIDSSIIKFKKKEILESVFADLYTKKDSDFLKLVGDFTNRDDEVIINAVLSISDKLDLKYDKEDYLNNYIDNFFKEENVEKLFLEYFNYLKDIVLNIEDIIYTLEGLVDLKLFIKLYDAYSPLFKPKCYNDLYKVKDIPVIQFRDVDEEVKEYKDILNNLKKEIMDLTKYSEEEWKKQIIFSKEYIRAIIKIILCLDKKLKEYKFLNESFEFVDIAKMAIKIVSDNEQVREELKDSYHEILIDEYQDTNDLQEIFINKIENNNVYMVGDIKQSIYRFRNANPNIFKYKYEEYSKNNGGVKIDLLKNFRSRSEVLESINLIFNLIMSVNFGGVDYCNNHAMIFGNLTYDKEGNNSNNNFLELIKYNNEDKKFKNAEVEAFYIASDIKKKIQSGYQVFDFDLMQNRPVKFSDFCIILDRGTDMPLYKKIYEYLNIPLDVYLDSDLTEENDILIIKNIFNLILLIYHKDFGVNMRYSFVSVARSFIGSLEDSEIFELIDTNTFYETDIYKKCFKLAKNLNGKTPNSLLNEIVDEFNFYENLIKIGNVASAIYRIDYLISLASTTEALGYTILDFKNYLNDMIVNKEKISYKEKRGIGNCVKIMNIHKSKGLEFSICYFAGLKKDFNLQDLNSRFMFDNKYGILTPFYDEGIGTNFIKTLIKNNYYREEISEKIRLFYVALTRAKEKIIMVLPSFQKESSEVNRVNETVISKCRSFYDFLNTISVNLKDYSTLIDINSLDITKDYEISRVNINYNESKEKITFINNSVLTNLVEAKHASKTINNVINLDEAKKLDYGTKLHEMLEMTDFKEDSDNLYVSNLKKNFDFKNAFIYQELEFITVIDNIEYHGIIDLMLEYSDEIKIIDYKLKNIDDDLYVKQLSVYYDYIRSISDKKIKLYLYSLLDNKVKEIHYLESEVV